MTSKQILKLHSLYPKKYLGQHFLTDTKASLQIVKLAGVTPDDDVLEIGAGLGALTIPLARSCRSVCAVEKDVTLANILENQLISENISNVSILPEDILTINLPDIYRKTGKPLVVLGNLPYNISSQILVMLILNRYAIDRAILMFQDEMAKRLSAKPECKDYGRLTVMLKYCADVFPRLRLKASQFYPAPKIDSQVIEIRFKKRPDHEVNNEPFFFKVIKAAFSQRRKTLKNALHGSELHLESSLAIRSLEAAGIDALRRAETLSIEEFVRLANILEMEMDG